MNSFDSALRAMTFDYFGTSSHKTTPADFLARPDALLVDLRFDREHGALTFTPDFLDVLHIPLDELPDRHGEIPVNRPVGLFCSSDTRSSIALAYLKARGFAQVQVVAGGYAAMVGELMPGKVYKRRPTEV